MKGELRRLLSVALVWSMIVVPALPSWAAETRLSSIEGRLFEADLIHPAQGLQIEAWAEGSKTAAAASPTDKRGRFELRDLPGGSYLLLISDRQGKRLAAARVAAPAASAQELALALPRAGEGRSAPADTTSGTGLMSTAVGGSLIVIASAIVIGVALHQATKDDQPEVPPVSQSAPH